MHCTPSQLDGESAVALDTILVLESARSAVEAKAAEEAAKTRA